MTAFDSCLVAGDRWLELDTGERIELPVDRWLAEPDEGDELLLGRCQGPSIDLGCGPGRLVAALQSRGIPALGVDNSRCAVRLAAQRGATVLRRDIFDPLPGCGRWRHALLVDGNIGIGGNPQALLGRVARLLCSGGSVLVELAAPGHGVRRGTARIGEQDWFPWALLGVDAISGLAERAGLRTGWSAGTGLRWFVELVRP